MSKKYHGGKNKAQTTSQRYHGGKNNKQEVKIYKHKQTRNEVTASASADKEVKGQGCQGTTVVHHFSIRPQIRVQLATTKLYVVIS
jgi:hypothetical protein